MKSWWSLEAVYSQDETEELHERDDVRRAHVENLGPNQTCLNTTIRYSFWGIFGRSVQIEVNNTILTLKLTEL